MSELYADLIREYQRMEPDGADTWNPLLRDRELEYRLVLYRQLCLALRDCCVDLDRLRVLDVGCGNGRSTRMYLDFGIRPPQITGIDLRPAALKLARGLHPGIAYLAVESDGFPLADAAVDWVSLCTVLSSVGGDAARQRLAGEIDRVLAPGGYLFYFDRISAHGFAGGDELDPLALMSGTTPLQDQTMQIQALPGQPQQPATATHRVCLLRKSR